MSHIIRLTPETWERLLLKWSQQHPGQVPKSKGEVIRWILDTVESDT